jgi:hypothetical protein
MLMLMIYQFCLMCYHLLPAIVASWGVVLLLTGYAWGIDARPRLRFEAILNNGIMYAKGVYEF